MRQMHHRWCKNKEKVHFILLEISMCEILCKLSEMTPKIAADA